MTYLRDLLPHLAPMISEVSPVTDAAAGRRITDAVIFDGSNSNEVSPGDLVLGIGLSGPEQVAGAAAALAGRSPAALVVRPGTVPVAAATTDDLPVVVLGQDTAWMQLVRLLHELLDGQARTSTGPPWPDDLFAVANAIAGMVQAPVTIEDPHWQVLAFSESQEGADPARTATILSRRGPEEYVQRMRARGVFRLIHSATRPVFVHGRGADILPRVVAPVRAGGEFLGSIWAVVTEPLPAEREEALAEAARMLALNLLRHRVVVDGQRAREIEVVSRVLDGGSAADEVIQLNHLTGAAYVLIAMRPDTTDAVDAEAQLRRLWDLMRPQLSAAGRR